MHANHALITRQIELIKEILAPLLPRGTPYALVEFPDHSNVGDSAIWCGEIEILKSLTGLSPAYTCSLTDFSAANLRRHHPIGPILIHGGGNLGDIWPDHQDMRTRVLKEFKDRTIIQLPQTIQFNDPANAREFKKLAREQGDFWILTRDRRSLAIAQDFVGERARLSPDCAFGMGALTRPAVGVREVFCLLREDAEKSAVDYSIFDGKPGLTTADWLVEPEVYKKSPKLRALPAVLASGRINRQNWRNLRYDYMAARRVSRGLRMLSQGKVVITDRLHAHILSVLLGIPNIVLDNNYGKIHGYMDAWTADAYKAFRATSPKQAFELLSSLQS